MNRINQITNPNKTTLFRNIKKITLSCIFIFLFGSCNSNKNKIPVSFINDTSLLSEEIRINSWKTTGSISINKDFIKTKTSIDHNFLTPWSLPDSQQNIVGTQVVWGKEFQGAAFISKPAKIVFKDFDVGKKMKIRFSLTNVSYTFNSFKLLDLDDEIKDFFEITYTKPGRMSAGTSCSILIEFEPKLNQDIVSVLRLARKRWPQDCSLCTIRNPVCPAEPNKSAASPSASSWATCAIYSTAAATFAKMVWTTQSHGMLHSVSSHESRESSLRAFSFPIAYTQQFSWSSPSSTVFPSERSIPHRWVECASPHLASK